ncbi:hypothetical protein [Chelatococcus sp.]|uniref:hypothetical protein n=1 Tax=Chelatococcus sp. TaxID=1953771 RepID=UPI001ECB8956|nr:hypothetical protein [Chelatococcus sp.]MBX3547350.1 hypothetical protein [Chelatococcus sp.]MCO5077273.1 hypothetical protein [Chelatococcus sp.]CAH1670792.1 conserved exported hypothetical protein [Hyphomicrobiales bacterium]CAH1676988.1 conserved exported hypothetical protein [Hyphomicrobiales bacterium]
MRWIVVVAPLALVGCVAAKPGAETVRLTSNVEQVRGCSLIRQETVGIHNLESINAVTIQKDIVTKFRNAAASAGATDALTQGPSLNAFGTAATMTGDLYRCG